MNFYQVTANKVFLNVHSYTYSCRGAGAWYGIRLHAFVVVLIGSILYFVCYQTDCAIITQQQNGRSFVRSLMQMYSSQSMIDDVNEN